MNTFDFLDIAASICPDRVCVVFEGNRWTYAEVLDRVGRLAGSLDRLGLGEEDRVGFLQVNCPQYVEAYFAAALLGAVFIPLNFRAKSEELRYMIDQGGVKLLFLGDRYYDLIEPLRSDLPSLDRCILLDGHRETCLSYEDLFGSASDRTARRGSGENEITIVIYTAGTTGHPKGVSLRHSAFVSYALNNLDPADPDVEERNLLSVPLHHVAGFQAMLASIYGGRTLIMMKQFDAVEWLAMVEREGATRAMVVPTMLKRILDDPDFGRYDLSSLKVITYGAAPMPFETIDKAIRMMPWVRFFNAFGQTETGSTITALGPEDHILQGTPEEREKKLRRLRTSIGKPLADVEVRIVDETGRPLAPFQVGEIVARGPRIMAGYWGDDEKSRQAVTPDGWLHTGDMGWMDDDGYIHLSGRSDEVIIRGGENISPAEVEDVLRGHPKIEDAAVIGVPHPEWGEEPRAIVVLKPDERATPEEIMEYCRTRLAGYKRPRSVVFVEDLPRNPLGKVLKKDLRARYGQP